jgi:hypothetical protein
VRIVLPENIVLEATTHVLIVLLDTQLKRMLQAVIIDVVVVLIGPVPVVLRAVPENTPTTVRLLAQTACQIQIHPLGVPGFRPVPATPALRWEVTDSARLYRQGVGLDINMQKPGVGIMVITGGNFVIIVRLICVWTGMIIQIFNVEIYLRIEINVGTLRYVVIVVKHVKDIYLGITEYVDEELTPALNAVRANTVRVTCKHAQIVLQIQVDYVEHALPIQNVPATPDFPDRTEERVHNAWPANTKQDKAVHAVPV